jgi:hypothetical protein
VEDEREMSIDDDGRSDVVSNVELDVRFVSDVNSDSDDKPRSLSYAGIDQKTWWMRNSEESKRVRMQSTTEENLAKSLFSETSDQAAIISDVPIF